jgi:hypothetical protein
MVHGGDHGDAAKRAWVAGRFERQRREMPWLSWNGDGKG